MQRIFTYFQVLEVRYVNLRVEYILYAGCILGVMAFLESTWLFGSSAESRELTNYLWVDSLIRLGSLEVWWASGTP